MYVTYFCHVSIGLNKKWRSDSYFKIGTFYTQQRKDDVIVTSLSILSGFSLIAKYSSYPKAGENKALFSPAQSNSVQNLSSLTLNTNELWRGGGWKTPPRATPVNSLLLLNKNINFL